MSKTTLRSRAGFTLIELLTVIAIIGILAAILFPAIGAAKKAAQKANDLSNIRSLGQAALIYSSDNNDRLPDPQKTNTITGGSKYQTWFGLMAKAGNLNDPSIVFSKLDPMYPAEMPTSIISPSDNTKNALDAKFLATATIPSYEVVGGLKASDPSTCPIAFTRGLQTSGSWDINSGTYGSEGGMIVFVGGNVNQYKSIGSPALLIQTNGNTTLNITQAVPYVNGGNQRIYGPGSVNGGSTVGSTGGTASTPAGSASGSTN
ncbi:MAG TPA: prepilin-type N-terminal cleavage/methylation domain-containing protein [Rariglobus sp.]|jgi:prepilin-type N-terminal cleavage/methylation domain-containing protein|nr:prepilin-type N-terminal cleavage/methylation domain-containing protein [Rariglobus sp.]